MAIDVYLQIDGIKGESQDSAHQGWIELTSAHWGVTQPRSATVSTSGGHTAERCEHLTLSLSKLADLSSPILMQTCSMVKTVPKAKLEFMRADSDGKPVKFSGNEGGELVIPHELRGKLTMASTRTSPQMNISAGVAYLLMRLASYGFVTVRDEQDTRVHDVLVKSGDSLEKIAKLNATTVDTLRKSNAGALILRPGQSLKYQKASIQKTITRWSAVNATSIARLYNVGDPAYAKKLMYCISVMQKSKHPEVSCA